MHFEKDICLAFSVDQVQDIFLQGDLSNLWRYRFGEEFFKK